MMIENSEGDAPSVEDAIEQAASEAVIEATATAVDVVIAMENEAAELVEEIQEIQEQQSWEHESKLKVQELQNQMTTLQTRLAAVDLTALDQTWQARLEQTKAETMAAVAGMLAAFQAAPLIQPDTQSPVVEVDPPAVETALDAIEAASEAPAGPPAKRRATRFL